MNKNIEDLEILTIKRIKREENLVAEDMKFVSIKEEGCVKDGIMLYDNRKEGTYEDKAIIEAVTYEFICNLGTYFITSMDLKGTGQCYRVCKFEPENSEYEVLQDDEKFIRSLGYGETGDDKFFCSNLGFYKVNIL